MKSFEYWFSQQKPKEEIKLRDYQEEVAKAFKRLNNNSVFVKLASDYQKYLDGEWVNINTSFYKDVIPRICSEGTVLVNSKEIGTVIDFKLDLKGML